MSLLPSDGGSSKRNKVTTHQKEKIEQSSNHEALQNPQLDKIRSHEKAQHTKQKAAGLWKDVAAIGGTVAAVSDLTHPGKFISDGANMTGNAVTHALAGKPKKSDKHADKKESHARKSNHKSADEDESHKKTHVDKSVDNKPKSSHPKGKVAAATAAAGAAAYVGSKVGANTTVHAATVKSSTSDKQIVTKQSTHASSTKSTYSTHKDTDSDKVAASKGHAKSTVKAKDHVTATNDDPIINTQSKFTASQSNSVSSNVTNASNNVTSSNATNSFYNDVISSGPSSVTSSNTPNPSQSNSTNQLQSNATNQMQSNNPNNNDLATMLNTASPQQLLQAFPLYIAKIMATQNAAGQTSLNMVAKPNLSGIQQDPTYSQLFQTGQLPSGYATNVNGSDGQIYHSQRISMSSFNNILSVNNRPQLTADQMNQAGQNGQVIANSRDNLAFTANVYQDPQRGQMINQSSIQPAPQSFNYQQEKQLEQSTQNAQSAVVGSNSVNFSITPVKSAVSASSLVSSSSDPIGSNIDTGIDF